MTVAHGISAVSWEAAATFATGAAAVLSATIVGLRQVAISNRQIKQAEEQRRSDRFIQEQSLRIQILDRRAACIARIRPILSEFHSNVELSVDARKELYLALTEAQMVFSADISDRLRNALSASEKQRVFQHHYNNYAKHGNTVEADRAFARVSEAEDRMFEAIEGILDKMIAETRLLEIEASFNTSKKSR